MRIKLLNSCIKEVIIYNFHKRLDRLRISVAIIAVKICDAAVSNEDRSLFANQTKMRVSLFHKTREGLDKRALSRVLIALIREIMTRNRDGMFCKM